MDVRGKRAIVLGGTSGIGLAAVRQLADAGAEVIAGSRSEANAEAAANALGAGVSLRRVDVLDRDGLSALFADLAPFDILVNAATGGARALGPFLSMDLDGFQGSFRKLWGYTNSVRLAPEHMTEDGVIVLVSGYPARKCPPGSIAISTVGNAVEGFVRGVAPELAPKRINVVSPESSIRRCSRCRAKRVPDSSTTRHAISRSRAPAAPTRWRPRSSSRSATTT